MKNINLTTVSRSSPAEIDWARLAAFIDGEGCIGLVCYKNVYTCIQIQIVNTNRKLIDWCEALFGGRSYTRVRSNPKHKPTHTWIVTSASAAFVIKGCYPYFIIKKEQAQVALEFISTIDKSISNYRELAIHQREYRKELIDKMHILNKKGVA